MHCFAVRRWEMEESDALRPPLVTWAHHGEDFVAAVENGALAATQFHPEKSGDAGRDGAAQLAARRRGLSPGPACPAAVEGRGPYSRVTLHVAPRGRRGDGQAVRLVQGEAGTETSYGDPRDAALAWQRDGAEWIHLVDLDAAFGRGDNAELLAAVVGELDVRVELSGGIRDDASLERALATGCARVNLGTAALDDPEWVRAGDRRARRADRRRARRAHRQRRPPPRRARLARARAATSGRSSPGWSATAAPATSSPT